MRRSGGRFALPPMSVTISCYSSKEAYREAELVKVVTRDGDG